MPSGISLLRRSSIHNLTIKGKVLQQSDAEFATRLEATLFNKRPLTRKHTAKFVADNHLRQLQTIRQARDKSSLFHEWHSKPQLAAA
jgi:hypothetical protein